MTFKVRYYAGPYSGVREAEAEDSEIAIAKVKAQIHREMSLPMYAEGYRVVDSRDAEAHP